jgi:hypothetical protein
MSDMSKTVVPKSDQKNYDDLISGSITIKVTKVDVGNGDQPVSIHYEGDQGKPFKPCMSMRRILIHGWGTDGDDYIGKQMTLYGDPTVKWAGQEIGGIRISHMSHLEKKLHVMLTVTRGKRSPYIVEQLITEEGKALTEQDFETWSTEINSAATVADLQALGKLIKAEGLNDAGNKRVKAVFKAAQKAFRNDT